MQFFGVSATLMFLIRPYKGGWRYDETDRPRSVRHSDWLWRIADHQSLTRKAFEGHHRKIYAVEWFSNQHINATGFNLGNNYISFSGDAGRTFISPRPPIVATAKKGEHEVWNNAELKRLTVDASRSLKSRRDYLRVANSSGRNVHRQIRFEMEPHEAIKWRASLISALKHATRLAPQTELSKFQLRGVSRAFRCG